MTITAIALSREGLTYSGSHQDIIVYRNATKSIESFPTYGTWVGMLDDIETYMQNYTITLNSGDLVLLFTDGITELNYNDTEMYGDERLKESLIRFSHLPGKQIVEQIIQNALSTAKSQDDDITLVLLKKV